MRRLFSLFIVANVLAASVALEANGQVSLGKPERMELFDKGEVVVAFRDCFAYSSPGEAARKKAKKGEKAVPLEEGTSIKVRACKNDIVCFRLKKKVLYVSTETLETPCEWEFRLKQRKEEEQRKKRLQQVLQGEAAQPGLALVRCLTCGCFTALQAKEYKQLSETDPATAAAWIQQKAQFVKVLEPGAQVVLMEIYQGLGVAKISTKSGEVMFCKYADLVAPAE